MLIPLILLIALLLLPAPPSMHGLTGDVTTYPRRLDKKIKRG